MIALALAYLVALFGSSSHPPATDTLRARSCPPTPEHSRPMKRKTIVLIFAIAAGALVAQSAFGPSLWILDNLPVTPATLRMKADAADYAASPEFVGPTTDAQRAFFAGKAAAYREIAAGLDAGAPHALGYDSSADTIAAAPVRTWAGRSLYVAQVYWSAPLTSREIIGYEVEYTPYYDTPKAGFDYTVVTVGPKPLAYVHEIVMGGLVSFRVRAIYGDATASAWSRWADATLAKQGGAL